MQEKASSIIQAIIIISSIFTLVAAFLVSYLLYFNKRKAKLIDEKNKLAEDFEQQLLKSQVEVQETTYNILSKELHDNVGQLLSAAKMLLGLTERSMEKVPDTLITANATLGKAIHELRTLSKSMDKEWLEQFSFNENLISEINRINSANIIVAKFINTGNIPLRSDNQIILFRMVQEAIQNAIKHAKPKELIVSIIKHDKWINIIIYDDGKGFTENNESKGMGISNMKHRAKILGGTIKWQSEPMNGTTVTITLPINPEFL